MIEDPKKYICPLCGGVVRYQHIIEAHAQVWDSKYPTSHMPQTASEFNKRFGPIGLGAKEFNVSRTK